MLRDRHHLLYIDFRRRSDDGELVFQFGLHTWTSALRCISDAAKRARRYERASSVFIFNSPPRALHGMRHSSGTCPLPRPRWLVISGVLGIASVDSRAQTVHSARCPQSSLPLRTLGNVLSETDWPSPHTFSNSVVAVKSVFACHRLPSNAGCQACLARPPWWLVSARDTLGWLANVDCSLAVSTCPPYDTAAEHFVISVLIGCERT